MCQLSLGSLTEMLPAEPLWEAELRLMAQKGYLSQSSIMATVIGYKVAAQLLF